MAPATSKIKRFRQKSYVASHMKRGGLLNKHICEKKIQISPTRQQKLSFSIFPIISLWELTIRCYSNQSSYPTGIKTTIYVEANFLSMYAKFQLHPPYGFLEDFFNIF